MAYEIAENSGYEEMAGKYLTFLSAGQYYAFSIVDVIEIIEIQEITDVPESPDYLKGIINLRGRIIPLVDMRLRFGKEEIDYTSRTCIIVINIRDNEIGFIVDTVSEVADIDASHISPPPPITLDRSGKYIMGIARIDGKIVLLLNQKKMFTERELSALVTASD